MKPLIYFLVFTMGITGIWYQFVLKKQPQALPRIKEVPQFSCTERSGATVTPATLRGHPWLASFIYTQCPGPCPRISANLAEFQDAAFANTDLRFVSFSLDPANDTPAVLSQYADARHASKDRWLFLTGDPKTVTEMASKGFLISRVVDKGVIIHGTQILLVDAEGMIRGIYEGTEEASRDKILNDLRSLQMEETRQVLRSNPHGS